MTKSIPERGGRAAALIVGVVALASPARSETIYSLKDGAACRDKDGAVQSRHSAPRGAVPAKMAPSGMIQVKGGWEKEDCYFFMSEVGLEPPGAAAPASCPTAAVGLEKSRLAGTRDIVRRCSK
jgi:hypothetical protein